MRGIVIFLSKCLEVKKNTLNFASLLRRTRAFSSAGSEHLPYKQRVGGSNPSTPTTNKKTLFFEKQPTFGRLAQLVQSICLTSRGSGVRIPQRPPPSFPLRKAFFMPCHNARRPGPCARSVRKSTNMNVGTWCQLYMCYAHDY